MIGVREVAAGGQRWGRAALLLGLVLLVLGHVAGMVHASPGTGASYYEVTVAHCAHHGQVGPHQVGESAPEHDHSADGHVDHTVDRPRASTADAPVLVATPDPLAPTGAVLSDPVPGDSTSAAADPPLHDSLLDLHCLRRQ
ncbi:hypothetical protein [Streptomyces sp. NPDC046821]|uniref:hypothetical protein n=1 Tax=Streptomyces sp. NPDC046821 TaxID=3154702 RepID=UPI0033ED7675